MLRRKIFILLKSISCIFVISFIFAIFFSCHLIDTENINSTNNIKEGLFSESNFMRIDPAIFKRYKKTYSNQPNNFIRFGSLLFYRAKKGERINDIARVSVVYTHYYKIYRLKKAIREFNAIDNNKVKKDTLIYIPYSLPPFLLDTSNHKKPEAIYSRGLYFTGNSIGNEKVLNSIIKYKKFGINTVVFDAKDVNGIVNYYSRIPNVVRYNTHRERPIDDIDKLIRILKQQNIYVIARISVFRDHLLCKENAGFEIKSHNSGSIWNAYSDELWCDPTNRQVQDYNIGLALELADKGVDEIQFDYIRFPTVGNLNDAKYSYDFGRMSKDATITLFLKRAYNKISKRNTLLSIDIFGVVAWAKEVDIRKTGQRIESLSQYCDIISPMLYPSHFNDDFSGFSDPGDEPYYFIYNGCKKTTALSNGKIIRPWLQAFSWRVSDYDEDYILKQIIGTWDGGAQGYLFWNSSNNYEVVIRALQKLFSLKKRKDKMTTSPLESD